MEKKILNDSNPEDFFYRRLRNLAEEVEEEKKNLHELTKRYYDLLGILENDVSRKIRLRWEGTTGFIKKDTQEEWVLIHIDFRRVFEDCYDFEFFFIKDPSLVIGDGPLNENERYLVDEMNRAFNETVKEGYRESYKSFVNPARALRLEEHRYNCLEIHLRDMYLREVKDWENFIEKEFKDFVNEWMF